MKVYDNNNSKRAAESRLYHGPSSECLVCISLWSFPFLHRVCSTIISAVQKRESDAERSANLPRVTQHTRVVAPGLEIRRVGSGDCTSKHSFTWLKRRQTFNQRLLPLLTSNFRKNQDKNHTWEQKWGQSETPPNTLPVRHLQDKGKR